MTITTTGLSGTDCLEQYGISDDMVCTGRISGLDITDNGGTITISPGGAYVKVIDVSGFEFNVKVYLDTATTLGKVNSSDIIIKVPLANVQNSQNNTDFTDIAVLEVVPTGTGDDFHLVLATISSGNVVSDEVNAGHYLPGCDFCMRCEGGVLQLPDTKINGDLEVDDIIADDISADQITANSFVGDGSGLTNIPAGTIPYMTETTDGLAQIASFNEIFNFTGNTVFTPTNIRSLLTFFPNWTLIDRIIEAPFTGTSGVYDEVGKFIARVPGTYRIAFIANEGRTRIKVNGVVTNGINVGGTASVLGSDIVNFSNTRYYDNPLSAGDGMESEYLFSKSTIGGADNDVYYGDFIVTNAMIPATISIENDGVGGNGGVSRLEILGTPFFYPR